MKCTSMKRIASLLIAALMAAACSNDAPDTPPAEPPRPTMNVQDSLAIVAFYHAMKCGEWKAPFHWDLTDYETWGGITAVRDAEKTLFLHPRKAGLYGGVFCRGKEKPFFSE